MPSNKTIFFFLFIFFFISIFLFTSSGENMDFAKKNFPGKGKEFRAAKNELEQGLFCFDKNMFADAYDHFIKANEFNPDNAELNYKIAYCLLNLTNKPDAIEFLSKAELLDSTISFKHTDFYYAMGLAYQYQMLWDKALEYYNKMLNQIPDGVEESQIWNDKVNKRIAECSSGMTIGKDTTLVIEPLEGINSEYDDYSNIIIQDSLFLFTSRRSRNDIQVAQIDNKFYEGIYAAQFLMTKVGFPEPVSFDRSNSHYAVAGGSEDKNTLLIYNNNNIFSSGFNGKKWSTPKILPIHTSSQVSSAWICEDGKTIYFVSDMPGGLGGKDIYMTQALSETEWSKPENLGEKINTPYDEEGIFVSGDTMYFGSKGHNSMGDFDIFMTYKSNNQWSQPVNIGLPFNSPFNDLYYFKSGEVAYVSSDRTGGKGGFDIYKITHNTSGHKDTTQGAPDILKIIKNEILPRIDTTPKPDTTKKAEPVPLPVITEAKKDTVIPVPVLQPVVEEPKKDTVKPQPLVVEEKNPEPVQPPVETVINKDTVTTAPVVEEKKPEPVVTVVPEEKSKPEKVLEVPVDNTVPRGVIHDFAYCMVQIGAYRFVRSTDVFLSFNNIVGYTVTMETHGNIVKDFIDKKFYNTDSTGLFSGHNSTLNQANELLLKCQNEFHISDAFLAIYNKEGKRVAIIWDVERMKYKIITESTHL